MTAYNTIEQAFQNGSGDTFFQKDGKFVAVSRKDESTHDKLIDQGFEFLPWHLALEIGKSQIETTEIIESTPRIFSCINSRVAIVKSYSNCSNGRDGYYDEFPDAYGQSL